MKGAPGVVIIDDASFARGLVRKLLEGAGFKVLAEGSDGYEAIELYEKFRPDLLTLDIVMPGLDGLSALEKIREIDPEASVLVVSSVGDEDIFLKAMKLGARDFATKPLDPQRFIQVVRKVLGML